jgi:Uma2 family endonuclease
MQLSEPFLRRFRVDEVLRMVEVGVLREDEPLELLDGGLVVVSPQGPAHSYVVHHLRRLLEDLYGREFQVREEKPLIAGVESLPEPDLAVLPGGDREWIARHPDAGAAVLIVEVAATSIDRDRGKAAIYAAAGAQAYWIVDLEGRCVEEHLRPIGARYGLVRIVDEDGDLQPPGTHTALRVADLLP